MYAATATAAACVYATGSFVCHQRPERSFLLAGRQMPVCARCAGLYAAAAFSAFGLGVTSAVRRFRFGGTLALTAVRARWMAFIAALPTIVTWLVEHLGFVQLSNATRFLAALPLGAAVMWLLQSVIDLQDKIQRNGTLMGREFHARTVIESPAPLAVTIDPKDAVVAPGDFASSTRLHG